MSFALSTKGGVSLPRLIGGKIRQVAKNRKDNKANADKLGLSIKDYKKYRKQRTRELNKVFNGTAGSKVSQGIKKAGNYITGKDRVK